MHIVRGRHEDAVAHLRERELEGTVGPTSASGWTCIWLDFGPEYPSGIDDPVGLGFAESVWVEDTVRGLLMEVRRSGVTERLTFRPAADPDQVNRVAVAVVDLFGPSMALAEVQELLSRDTLDDNELAEGLETLLALPELRPTEPSPASPERTIIATRGDESMVRMALTIAGPAWALPPDQGWTIAMAAPAGSDQPAEVLAAAVSATTKRRDRTVLIWRRDSSLGLQVWRRGTLQASWTWGTGWDTVVTDSLEFETSVCDEILAVNPSLHLPTLRSLMRRPDLDKESVATLLGVLGLPPCAHHALSMGADPGRLPDAAFIDRGTTTRAWIDAVAVDHAQWVTRMQRSRFYPAYAIGTAVAALVCLLLAVMGAAVLITDGSVVDEAGATSEDWLTFGILATLTVVLVPTAVVRLKRLRGGRR